MKWELSSVLRIFLKCRWLIETNVAHKCQANWLEGKAEVHSPWKKQMLWAAGRCRCDWDETVYEKGSAMAQRTNHMHREVHWNMLPGGLHLISVKRTKSGHVWPFRNRKSQIIVGHIIHRQLWYPQNDVVVYINELIYHNIVLDFKWYI